MVVETTLSELQSRWGLYPELRPVQEMPFVWTNDMARLQSNLKKSAKSKGGESVFPEEVWTMKNDEASKEMGENYERVWMEAGQQGAL